jgi:glutamine synthetase
MTARFEAIRAANSREVRTAAAPAGPDGKPLAIAAYYGKNTFSVATMALKLPKPVYKRVKSVIEQGAHLDRADADVVAHAVKEWALENGCTHYTHWFQPMTGATAEKHDAFLTLDDAGGALERFSGDALIQSEPDASSFPSGGMRSTFEARGYTAWDPSSPIFIMESENGNTLCIPSAYISYTGEALDKKTPLLRSMQAIDKAAGDLLVALGYPRTRTVATLGCEQEYFLIDRAYWSLRPDLAISGRTLVGAPPPKGQSMEDHYFGSIPPRVLAFMQEVEIELYKLGVPAKTRHNEVAPAQYEIAPIFKEANVGSDQNQLVQEVLRRVATRHGFKAILAEKPFAGINGSGKHNNWSLASAGENLLDPGDNPSANLRFLAVLASVMLAVKRYGGLLRCSVATYGNDFRLGANEAPPAIMSVFLGELLSKICDALASGEGLPKSPQQAMLELGVSSIPHVAKDNTDRNRTSPVAFTGNKFEFRAVGSSQNSAWPMTVLNTIVAEAMTQITAWIKDGKGGEKAAFDAIRKAIKEGLPVRFDGNGYSQEWRDEAARRGLPNHAKTPDALAELKSPAVVALFEKHGVLSPAEVAARYNIYVEQYVKTADIEADCYRLIVDEMVLPAALAERKKAADALLTTAQLASAGVKVDTSADATRVTTLSNLIADLQAARADLESALDRAHHEAEHDAAYAKHVLPVFERLRGAIDGLEPAIEDAAWPLPKYREMLFLF